MIARVYRKTIIITVTVTVVVVVRRILFVLIVRVPRKSVSLVTVSVRTGLVTNRERSNYIFV